MPTVFIMNYVQPLHLDLDFYDRFFKPGACLRTHAEHMERYGIRRADADAFETWEGFRFDPQDIRAIEDRVVWLGRATNEGRGEAPTVAYEAAYLFELRHGKIVYARPYQSRREALEAAGLAE